MVNEFRQLIADKRVLGLLLGGPVVLVLLFGWALKLTSPIAKIAVVNDVSSPVATAIAKGIKGETSKFAVTDVGTMKMARESIASGKVNGIVHITNTKINHGNLSGVQILINGTNPAEARTIQGNLIGAIDEATIPVVLNHSKLAFSFKPEVVRYAFNPKLSYSWYFLPGVLGILILQACLVIASMSLVREKEQGSWDQLLALPVSFFSILMGKMMTYLTLGIVDAVFITALSHFWFRMPVHSLPYAGLVFLFFITSSIFLGMLSSALAANQQQALLSAVFILVPSLLLSGFVFPIGSMPSVIQDISHLIPLTYFINGIRSTFIEQRGWGAISSDLFVLIAFSVLLGSVVFRLIRRRI